MKRDNCFDFLRFLFAFNVVLGHLTVISTIPQLRAYIPWSQTYLSVTGFFVISGFLIAQSFERSTSIKSYFQKRARRLLPAYLLVVLGCAFGLVGLSTFSAGDYFRSPDWWQYIGANLCFLNFLHPSLPGVFEHPMISDTCVNGALWTLKIEVGFYLIVPLLMIWLRKTRQPWMVLLAIYILAIGYRTGLNWFGEYSQTDMPVFLARQLPGFMSYFAVGMAGFIYKDKFLLYRHYMILPAVAVYAAELYLGYEILMPLAWGIMVLWCAWSIPALNNFAKYGDISYGVYIYHVPILKIMLSVGVFTALDLHVAIVFYLICVLIIGLASWHLMESRFLKRKMV